MNDHDEIVELILGKLDGIEKRGGYWMARCPHHEDREASLKVMRGTDHPAVLKCYAGCATQDVLAEIGLTIADISAPRDHARAADMITYDYTDERGGLLYQVVRKPRKKFRQRVPDASQPDGWRWSLGNTRRVLYRLPKVIEAVAAGEFVYIAEGEKDVQALEAAGVTATCNSGGAGKWRAEFAEVLRGAIVTIIADKDEPDERGRRPGLDHARQIEASLLGVARAVEIVQAAAGKDAADHLAAGYTVGQFEPLTDSSDTGQERVSENPGALTSDSGTSGSSGAFTQYRLRDGAWLDAQDFAPLPYVVPGLMPAGLGVIAAPPKAGKSLLVLDWLLAVALGGSALGRLPVGQPRDVLYLALEDGDRRLQARCRHLLADGEPIPERFRYVLAVPPGQVLAVIGDALSQYPETALVVIDTLGRIMPLPQQGETTYQRDYRVAAALKRVADERPSLAMVVIHHTRKAASDDFVDSLSGTHGIAGAADTIITLARGRGKGDGTLQVTGRDVIEASYAVKFSGGSWFLDGATLDEARKNVARRADEAAVSGRSAEIIDFVREAGPDGRTAKQVRDKFGDDSDSYLKRHTDAKRLLKPRRGLYVVPEPSEPSEPQVSDGKNSDTPESEVSETDSRGDRDLGYLARRDLNTPDRRPPCDANDPDHEACWDLLDGRCLKGTS